MVSELIRDGVSHIRRAMADYLPGKVYVLVSGGYDSTVVAHMASHYGPRVDGLVHINTGIGIDETREFVRSYAQYLELPLIEKFAPRTYEDLVMEYGFPGPGAHRYMYSWLKERALREVRREAQLYRGDRVMFITGVRSAESTRRMGNVKPVQRTDSMIWVSPIGRFTKADIHHYLDQHELPRNEVVAKLHMSGECLCGSFSRPGELDEIAFFFPEVARRIRDLEQKAHDTGIKSCHWGPQSSKKLREAPGPLCSDCVFAAEESEITIVKHRTVRETA